MDDQVGVAPDRRGEVDVIVEAEAEVFAGFGGVARALQISQDGKAGGIFQRRAGECFEYGVDVASCGGKGVDAERLQFSTHLSPLVFVRRLVNPVDGGPLRGFEFARDGDVGEQHALFDQLIGLLGFTFCNRCDFSVLANQAFDLWGVDLERAGYRALCAQSASQGRSSLRTSTTSSGMLWPGWSSKSACTCS